jgi:hypothetical protein
MRLDFVLVVHDIEHNPGVAGDQGKQDQGGPGRFPPALLPIRNRLDGNTNRRGKGPLRRPDPPRGEPDSADVDICPGRAWHHRSRRPAFNYASGVNLCHGGFRPQDPRS